MKANLPTINDVNFLIAHLVIYDQGNQSPRIHLAFDSFLYMDDFQQWNSWIQKKEGLELLIAITTKIWSVKLVFGNVISEIYIENDIIVKRKEWEENKRKYFQSLQLKTDNRVTYIQSYYVEEQRNIYNKMIFDSEKQGIGLDILFMSNVYEESSSENITFHGRAYSFLKNFFYFKPELYFIHTGYTFQRHTSDVISILNLIKDYSPQTFIIGDKIYNDEDDFYIWSYLKQRNENIASYNKSIYLKNRDKIFSTEHHLLYKFKKIIANV